MAKTISIEIVCSGEKIEQLPVAALDSFAEDLRTRISLLQVLSYPKVKASISLGVKGLAADGPKIDITIYGLPKQPRVATIQSIGIADYVRGPVEKNVNTSIRHFCKDNKIQLDSAHTLSLFCQ